MTRPSYVLEVMLTTVWRGKHSVAIWRALDKPSENASRKQRRDDFYSLGEGRVLLSTASRPG